MRYELNLEALQSGDVGKLLKAFFGQLEQAQYDALISEDDTLAPLFIEVSE